MTIWKNNYSSPVSVRSIYDCWELSLKEAVSHSFSLGTLVCGGDRGGGSQLYQALCFRSEAGGVFSEHLPKSDMFDSFSSPQPQVLHTLSVWCWSPSPVERGGGEKAEDSCCGLSGTQASTEHSARREDGGSWSTLLCSHLYVRVCIAV